MEENYLSESADEQEVKEKRPKKPSTKEKNGPKKTIVKKSKQNSESTNINQLSDQKKKELFQLNDPLRIMSTSISNEEKIQMKLEIAKDLMKNIMKTILHSKDIIDKIILGFTNNSCFFSGIDRSQVYLLNIIMNNNGSHSYYENNSKESQKILAFSPKDFLEALDCIDNFEKIIFLIYEDNPFQVKIRMLNSKLTSFWEKCLQSKANVNNCDLLSQLEYKNVFIFDPKILDSAMKNLMATKKTNVCHICADLEPFGTGSILFRGEDTEDHSYGCTQFILGESENPETIVPSSDEDTYKNFLKIQLKESKIGKEEIEMNWTCPNCPTEVYEFSVDTCKKCFWKCKQHWKCFNCQKEVDGRRNICNHCKTIKNLKELLEEDPLRSKQGEKKFIYAKYFMKHLLAICKKTTNQKVLFRFEGESYPLIISKPIINPICKCAECVTMLPAINFKHLVLADVIHVLMPMADESEEKEINRQIFEDQKNYLKKLNADPNAKSISSKNISTITAATANSISTTSNENISFNMNRGKINKNNVPASYLQVNDEEDNSEMEEEEEEED